MVTLDAAVTFPSSSDGVYANYYDSGEDAVVFTWRAGGGPWTAQAITPASTNLTAQAFVGVADSAISASAAGSVIVQGGTVTGLSSLTTGSKYFVQTDGTFGTSAGDPSVNAGLAISTTSLLLNGDS